MLEPEIPSFIFYRKNGLPRNFVEPQINSELTESDITRLSLHAKILAFKKSQRRFGIGIVVGMGALQNVINQPDSLPEFAFNFTVPGVVQGLSYLSFRKAINLMRQEIQPHIKFE